jgi:hypothetical protein
MTAMIIAGLAKLRTMLGAGADSTGRSEDYEVEFAT